MPSARAAIIWPGGIACSAPRSTSASRHAVCSVSAASAMLNLDTPPPSSMGSTNDANSSCVTSGTPRTASIRPAAASDPARLPERRSRASPKANGTAAASAAIASISVTSSPPQRCGPIRAPPHGQPVRAPAAMASSAASPAARTPAGTRRAPSVNAIPASNAAQAVSAGPRSASAMVPNNSSGRFSPTAAQQAPAACAQAAGSPCQTARSTAQSSSVHAATASASVRPADSSRPRHGRACAPVAFHSGRSPRRAPCVSPGPWRVWRAFHADRLPPNPSASAR
ncbi:hypothetical protein D3C87_1054060 [compost metagenome]